jgi:AcrR family transcriptional regulator
MATRPSKPYSTPTRGARAKAPARPPARAAARTAIEVLRGDVMKFKRERILQEAAALFFERGYMQTTMDAIAERMGATKPFVYYHFESKAEMLVEICERATAQALEAAERALGLEGPPAAKFEAFVRDFTRVALSNHTFVAIYFREEFSLPEAARAHINQMRKALDRKLRGLIAEGAASGDFDVDDPGITALVVAGMASYAFAWYRDTGRLGLDAVVEQVVRMAMRVVVRASAQR